MKKLQPGITRAEVEAQLGEPVESSAVAGGGSKAEYRYKLGDEPAPGRALMHLGLDIITLCLWEYVAFPMEISMSGNAYEMLVEYDRDQKARYFKISEVSPADES